MSTVNEIIDESNQRVTEAVNGASIYLNALESLANGMPYDIDHSYNQHIPVADIADLGVTAPEREDLVEDSVEGGLEPEDVDVSLWVAPNVPEFNEMAPTLDLPSKPNIVAPQIPVLPNIESISLPTAPNSGNPSVPEIQWDDLPILSNVEMPIFDIKSPKMSFLVPTNNFIFEENSYSSKLTSQLSDILSNDLENGGYGINSNDEQDLFNRERDRENLNSLAFEHELQNIFASKGFPIPPGAVLVENQKILEKQQLELSSVNRDIALKRSELYVQARQFTIQHGISWEQAFFTLQNSKMERALNYGKATSEFTLQFYNAEAQRFNVEISVFESLRQSYQSQLDGVRVVLDEQRSQRENTHLSDARQKNILELHKVKVATVEATYGLYRTKLEASKAQIDINRLKIEQYRTSVSAYSEEVRSNSVELDSYKTLTSTETIKLDQFVKSLNAHEAKTRTSQIVNSIGKDQYEAELKAKVTNLTVMEQRIRIYEIQLRNAIQVGNLKAKENDQDLVAWNKTLSVLQGNQSKDLQTELENHKGRIETIRLNHSSLIDVFNSHVKEADVRKDAADAGVRLYENMIAGAESSLSAIATLSEDVAQAE